MNKFKADKEREKAEEVLRAELAAKDSVRVTKKDINTFVKTILLHSKLPRSASKDEERASKRNVGIAYEVMVTKIDRAYNEKELYAMLKEKTCELIPSLKSILRRKNEFI